MAVILPPWFTPINRSFQHLLSSSWGGTSTHSLTDLPLILSLPLTLWLRSHIITGLSNAFLAPPGVVLAELQDYGYGFTHFAMLAHATGRG